MPKKLFMLMSLAAFNNTISRYVTLGQSHQATSYFLNICWSLSTILHGIIKPQWAIWPSKSRKINWTIWKKNVLKVIQNDWWPKELWRKNILLGGLLSFFKLLMLLGQLHEEHYGLILLVIYCNTLKPGPCPTDGISFEFEICSKFGVL